MLTAVCVRFIESRKKSDRLCWPDMSTDKSL